LAIVKMALKDDISEELTKTPFVVKKKIYRMYSLTYPVKNE
jgi:hypothetical protein